MTTKTFTISREFVVALVNSDESGLSASDSQALNEFVVSNKIKHTIFPDGDKTNFTRCQVTGLASDCLEVTCEINEGDSDDDLARLVALAKHLDVTVDEAKESLEDYTVVTDDEADNLAGDYIRESLWAFNSSFLETYTDIDSGAIKAIQEKMSESCNTVFLTILKGNGYLNQFINDAISSDGRGHFLSSYDGEEHEQTVTGVTYYIYRNN